MALAITGCAEPTWIEVANAIGYAEPAKATWKRLQRCEPMSMTVPLKLADLAARTGRPEQALAILDEAEIRLGGNAWISGTRQSVLLVEDRFEEALALAPDVLNDIGFFGMNAEALPLARDGRLTSQCCHSDADPLGCEACSYWRFPMATW